MWRGSSSQDRAQALPADNERPPSMRSALDGVSGPFGPGAVPDPRGGHAPTWTMSTGVPAAGARRAKPGAPQGPLDPSASQYPLSEWSPTAGSGCRDGARLRPAPRRPTTPAGKADPPALRGQPSPLRPQPRCAAAASQARCRALAAAEALRRCLRTPKEHSCLARARRCLDD